MYQITVEFTFSYAHRLQNHPGKCRNLHGHNARVQVVLESPKLDENGMVVDFAHVKDVIGQWLDRHWDHATILEHNDPLLTLLAAPSYRVLATDRPPAAEVLARAIYTYAEANIDYHIAEVTLWENDRNSATYRGGK